MIVLENLSCFKLFVIKLFLVTSFHLKVLITYYQSNYLTYQSLIISNHLLQKLSFAKIFCLDFLYNNRCFRWKEKSQAGLFCFVHSNTEYIQNRKLIYVKQIKQTIISYKNVKIVILNYYKYYITNNVMVGHIGHEIECQNSGRLITWKYMNNF